MTVPVVLAEVTRGPAVSTVTLDGEVSSPGAAIISAEVAGSVATAPARVGDRVRVGSVIVTLDPASARIARDQAAANLARAEAQRAARTAAAARVRFETSRVLDVAKREPGGVSPREAQDAEIRLAEAEAAHAAAESEVQVATFALQAAELDLRRTSLVSPVAGVVSRQDATVGRRVAPGTALAAVVPTEGLEILVDVGEASAGRVQIGQAVAIRVPARPEIRGSGTVAGVVPAAEGGARAQRARVLLEDGGTAVGRILPGMAVRATIEVTRFEDAILVPRDAVTGGAVYTVAEGKAVRVPIVVAAETGERVVVVSGIDAGAQVVVRGNEALQEGTPVGVATGAQGSGGGAPK
jgi:multidrug efflux system membrane fusion protein